MNNQPLAKPTGRTTTHLLILVASVALLATACSKAANTNNANGSSTNKNSAASTSTTTTGSASSPTAAYKAFQEANKKKDYEGVKKRFSKASLEMLTEEAKKKNKTLDEFVRDQVDQGTNDEEVTNEKITGDTATVDLKDKNSSITLPMVKEDGEWKIAYDVFVKKMEEAFGSMSKEEPKTADKESSESDNSKDDK